MTLNNRMDGGSYVKHMIVLAVLSGVAACSNIQRDTYHIHLTTDQTPHTVELWEDYPDRYRYSVRFPQSYYAYGDNHFSRRQTTIGLLLDRETLRAWTEVVAAEKGITQPLDYPRWKELPLEAAALPAGHDDRRLLQVELRGAPMQEPKRELIGSLAGPGDKDIGLWRGFRAAARRSTTSPGWDIRGYSASGALVWVNCSGGAKRCLFDRRWRGSTITFYLWPEDVEKAGEVSDRLVALLERHLVADDTT